jgi:hypothetical protein
VFSLNDKIGLIPEKKQNKDVVTIWSEKTMKCESLGFRP